MSATVSVRNARKNIIRATDNNFHVQVRVSESCIVNPVKHKIWPCFLFYGCYNGYTHLIKGEAMQTIQDYVPITQAKNKLLDMVRSIHDNDNAIAITKNGIPEAVLISM